MSVGEWDIVRTTYRVSDFVSWTKSGTLELSPSFQRRPVWQPKAKSYLIDTIIRGLPIPIVFVRELPTDMDSFEPKREVVDGQQRLRTVLSFISDSLVDDFQTNRDDFSISRSHAKELANKRFKDLEVSYRQRILDYQFSVHVFPAHVNDRDILQIFARMNSTGVKLNAQELRNAEFFGEFKTLMYTLAAEQLPRWRRWGVFTEYEIARMEEVELTSEFALLVMHGVAGKSKAALQNAYAQYDDEFREAPEVARRVHAVMEEIDRTLGADLSRLVLRRKTVIYSLFATFYGHMYGFERGLTSARPKKLTPQQIDHIKSAADALEKKAAPIPVLESIARRTTNPGSRRVLIEFLMGSQAN